MSIVHIPIGFDRRLIDELSKLTAQLETRSENKETLVSRIQARVCVDDPGLFASISKMLAKYTGWENVGKWQERIVYTYDERHSTVIDGNGETIRSLTANQKGLVRAHFENESRLGPIEFVLEDLEEPESVAACVLPSKVTVLYQREYRQGSWKFVVVKRWESETLNKTFDTMTEKNASKQIWFTLCDTERYVKKHPAIYTALSFLMKASALMQNRLCLTLFTPSPASSPM